MNGLPALMNSDVKGSKRAELLLGWRPVVDLAEGLRATISQLSIELKQPEPQLL